MSTTVDRSSPSSASRSLLAVCFAAVALSFLLPFGTASCENDRVDFTGYDLVAGELEVRDASGRLQDDEVLGPRVGAAAGPALLALLFVGIGLVASVVPRRRTAGLAALAGVLGLAALAFLDTRGDLGVDRHHGFWLAYGFAAGAAMIGIVAWRGGPRAALDGRASASVLGAAASLVLLFGLVLPFGVIDDDQLSYLDYLSRSYRSSAFWFVLAPLGVALGVVVATSLVRGARDRLPAGLLAGFGLVGLADGVGTVLYISASGGMDPTSGGRFVIAGAVLALLAAGSAWRSLPEEAASRAPLAGALSSAGGALFVAAALLPHERFPDGTSEALLQRDLAAGQIWMSLPALVIAAAAVVAGVAAWRGADLSFLGGVLLSLGIAAVLGIASLLSPLTDVVFVDESRVGPAGFVGVAAAALVLAGGVVVTRSHGRARPTSSG